MRLVLYGGGHEGDSQDLDIAAIKLSNKKHPKITYIPACSYGAENDFKLFAKNFSNYNITKFVYFPVDYRVSPVLLQEAISSDIIHLSGGNTYYFLYHLRKIKMISHLKKFVQDGGVLTGLSAGAIIMSPTIEMAKYPTFDKDTNDNGMKNLKSLSLVSFDFCPHYKNSSRYETELISLSRRKKNPIYATPDGHGIIIDGDTVRFIGRAYCFFRGKKLIVSPDHKY